jgi:hypothetical protein
MTRLFLLICLFFSLNATLSSQATLYINIYPAGGDTVVVDVASSQLIDVQSLQFTLNYNLDKFELLGGVQGELENFMCDFTPYDQGHMCIAWFGGTPTTFPDCAVLFRSFFAGTDPELTDFSISSFPTPIEFTTPDGLLDPDISYAFCLVSSTSAREQHPVIQLTPNPTASEVFLSFDASLLQPATFHLFDLFGNLLFTDVISESKQLRLDVSQWSPGMYPWVVYQEGVVKQRGKLVVQH